MKQENGKSIARNIILSVVLIVILGFVVYGNSLSGVFLWDDNSLVTNNTSIKSWANIGRIFCGDMTVHGRGQWAFYRPLQITTYMVDHSLWGLNPAGYHLTNIILHVAAALCVYWLTFTIFKGHLLSFLAGAFFVIHPVHTEAVVYISGRADSLSLFFMLLCFILYIKSRPSRNMGIFIVMLFSYVLALLSKESSLILPLLLLLYHFSSKEKVRRKEFLSLLSLTLIYALARATFLKTVPGSTSHTSTLWERIPGFFVAITAYIKLLFLPLDLHMEYGKEIFTFADPKTILGIMIFLALWIYAIRRRNSNMSVFFSIAWFFLALLPVSNLYPINAFMAEHWLYLPSIGFFWILAKAISSLYQVKRFRMMTIVFIISLGGFYSYLTVRQNMYWREPFRFYQRNLQYTPNSPRLYVNIGAIYQSEGQEEKAIRAYKKAIEIRPDYAIAYYNLGKIYTDRHDYDTALLSYRKAVAIKPDYANAHNNLGTIYADMDRREEAKASFQEAIRLKPYYVEAYHNLGLINKIMGRRDEAITSFRKAIAINPDYPYPYDSLADIYFQEKEYDLAIKYFEKAKNLGLTNYNLLKALEPYRE